MSALACRFVKWQDCGLHGLMMQGTLLDSPPGQCQDYDMTEQRLEANLPGFKLLRAAVPKGV